MIVRPVRVDAETATREQAEIDAQVAASSRLLERVTASERLIARVRLSLQSADQRCGAAASAITVSRARLVATALLLQRITAGD